MKSKVKYDPPNRPLMTKPSTNNYRKTYDKIFGVVKKSIRIVSKENNK